MEWLATALGGVEGLVEAGPLQVDLTSGQSVRLPSDTEELALVASDGKFSSSEDSFLFCGFKTDPSAQSFVLSAVIVASETSEGADSQSGFGVAVVDTVASADFRCRHRNQLLVGHFGGERMGMRLVGGYADATARVPAGRITDQSRLFPIQNCKTDVFGAPHVFTLQKTGEGFTAICDGGLIELPGCDFLMQQSAGECWVGFAVARGVRATVSKIVLNLTEGHASHTPEGTIAESTTDYPFDRTLVSSFAPAPSLPDETASVIYASPDGEAGKGLDADCPTTIPDAIGRVEPGSAIVLLDGVYEVDEPLVIPACKSGTIDMHISLQALNPRACIVDGSRLVDGMPLLVLDADFWDIRGIVFRKAPLSGLTIFGSMNTVRNCEAAFNGDTGILLVSRPGAERAAWPQRNRIIDCDSHDNCDRYRCNADGFGAKLRVGKGNSFYRCVAYHNIDDGFDLYSKATFGPIDPVELDECIAYENGLTSREDIYRTRPGGTGFKLGGESQPVAHEAWNCIAFNNRENGFSSNSNPICSAHFCTSADNGGFAGKNFNFFEMSPHLRPEEGSLSAICDASQPPCVIRADDGSLQLKGALIEKLPTGQKKRRFGKAHRQHGLKRGASIGDRRNVLIVIDSLGGGGAERVACRLATKLSERANVFLMFFVRKETTGYPVGPGVTLIDSTQVPFRRLPKRIDGWVFSKQVAFQRFLRLRAVRRKHRIHTTISFLSTPNLLNALCKGGRRIVCERNDPSHKPKSYQRRSRYSCEHADYAVFQTRKVQGLYSQAVIEKSCIIPNPVSVSCHASPEAARKIVTVGRLNTQKNHRLLLEAFARFLGSHPDYSLHIFGIGDQLGALSSLAADLGISDDVHFEGFCDDVHAAIGDAEMFVLSSDFEGMPNALIEAMMMGLPCISTACTGSDELISDGVDGLLTPVGDAGSLCEAMCRLADSPNLRAALASNARLRALDFDIDDVIRKWERVL